MASSDLATPAAHGAPPPSSTAATGPHVYVVGELVAERYRLVERLGEGAMGAVWAAEHVHMRKRFAVKILHPDAVSSPEIVSRFEREAVAAANIVHPAVVAATDFGRLADGSFFLVLEYVAGKDLRHLVAGGALPVSRALDLTRQILLGLGAAHAKGVVHRDIKPENVMLVSRTESTVSRGAATRDMVKILDFGIAKVDANSFGDPQEGQLLTRMGSIYGTPNYMAPEQALGTAIDARADLYAVGVMLYEMIAGAPPFDGDPITVIAKQVNEAPPPLHSPLGPEALTPQLLALVDALLAKDREARPADAHAAIALLDAAAASLPADRQATMIGDPLELGRSPPPPSVGPPALVARARTALRPLAGKLGVKVDALMLGVAGAAAVLLLAIVYALARPSTANVQVEEEHRRPAVAAASTTASTPSTVATTTATATTATGTANSTATAKPTATGNTASGGNGNGSGSSGGKGPIKNSGGNSLVHKIKGIFK